MDKRLLSFDEFKAHCNNIFNNKYDYSESEYKGMKHPIKIVCPIHGEFTQKAQSHYLGHHCFKCEGNVKLTNKEIILEFIKKHGDRYDYSKIEYTNNKNKVEIICKKHGSFFQSPYEHKNGQGCPKCIKNRRLNKEMFIELSNKIHDFKYNYDDVNYVNSKIKVNIKCKKHGIFSMIPNHHLCGQGCPFCKKSLGELLIIKYLNDNKIKFEHQKFFKNLTNGNKNKRYLFFDFYLLEYNICIEFDGMQHFEPVEKFGGQISFEKLLKNDAVKNRYCVDNNIKLIRIPYFDIKKIKEILDKEITKIHI